MALCSSTSAWLASWSYWAQVSKSCTPDARTVLRLKLQELSLGEIVERTGLSHWKVQSLWKEVREVAMRVRDQGEGS